MSGKFFEDWSTSSAMERTYSKTGGYSTLEIFFRIWVKKWFFGSDENFSFSIFGTE